MDKPEVIRVLGAFNARVEGMYEYSEVAWRVRDGGGVEYGLTADDRDRATFRRDTSELVQTRAIAIDIRLFYQPGDLVSFSNVRNAYESGHVPLHYCERLGGLLADYEQWLDGEGLIRGYLVTRDDESEFRAFTNRDHLLAYLYGNLAHIEHKGNRANAEAFDFLTSNPGSHIMSRVAYGQVEHHMTRTAIRIQRLNVEVLEVLSTNLP